jgi:ribosomal protein S18 acetylase RimI-like enzyme
MTVRAITRDDLPAVKSVVDACGLFPSEMLDGMTAAYFGGNAAGEIWLTADEDGLQAVAYCAPERLTDGTWNVLLVAVHPDRQGQGIGTRLMRHLERVLSERGERVLLVETSGLPEFDAARAFYRGLGYDEEARIRDFYQAGDDKIVFRKGLGGAA